MSRFENWKKPDIIHNVPTQWNWAVSYPENLKLGQCVDIGAFTYIMAKAGVIIEDDVQIGGHCAIYSMNTIDDTQSRIVIERGAKIGAGSIILPSTDGSDLVIGKNSKIGAMTLVKRSIPPNTTFFLCRR